MFQKYLETIPILFHYNKIVRKYKPDVIVSKASFYASFIAKLHVRNRIKSVIFVDSEVVDVLCITAWRNHIMV
jgi:predicted glycosyltransferase